MGRRAARRAAKRAAELQAQAPLRKPDAQSFLLFPRFPAEVRNRIWELAMEPREVVVRSKWTAHRVPEGTGLLNYNSRTRIPITLQAEETHPLYYYSTTGMPTALQACKEARSLLLPLYTKAFSYGLEPRYIFINFDIDTVYLYEVDMKKFPLEKSLVRWLSVECGSPEFFARERATRLAFLPSLESVVIRTDRELITEWDDFTDGIQTMLEIFEEYRGSKTWPNVSIIGKGGEELNSGNWRRLDHEKRKVLQQRYPRINYRVTDSEDSASED